MQSSTGGTFQTMCNMNLEEKDLFQYFAFWLKIIKMQSKHRASIVSLFFFLNCAGEWKMPQCECCLVY